MKAKLFSECLVHDRKDFQEAGILLYDACHRLLTARSLKVVGFRAGHGRARLANLLTWNVTGMMEYLDGDDLSADQVVHFALHQMAHEDLGSDQPYAVLFAETLASAADIYLLGKLAQAGKEPDFIHETLESFGYFYETYSQGEEDMEALLHKVTNEPFAAMVDVTNYLFDFCTPMLFPETPDAPLKYLAELQPGTYYPLVHHYNVTNWILAIRARFPEPGELDPALDVFRRRVLCDETAFLQHIQAAADKS